MRINGNFWTNGASQRLTLMPKRPNLRRFSKPIVQGALRTGSVAEEVGFEPTKGVNPCWFSRPVHSTALPLLRSDPSIAPGLILKDGIEGKFADVLSHTFLGRALSLHWRINKGALTSIRHQTPQKARHQAKGKA